MNVDDKKWYKAITPSWSNLINAGMLLISFFVYRDAMKSKDDAVKSANNAERSASAAERFANNSDKANYISDKQLKLAKESFDSSVTMNQKSLNAQIQSLREAQKQFEISNEPFIQIDASSIVEVREGEFMGLTFDIKNIGNYPAKVNCIKLFIDARKAPPYVNINQGHAATIINAYIVKGEPLAWSTDLKGDIKFSTHDSVDNGSLFLYYYGYINYENLSSKNKTRKRYEFVIQKVVHPYGFVIRHSLNYNY